MPNIASQATLLEDWKRPEILVDGNTTKYNGHSGYSGASWSKNLTLEFDSPRLIHNIRFLLWDRDSRVYTYRLLTSLDGKSWQVHYDTGNQGKVGWQSFNFVEPIKAKFTRLHALWNSANGQFHIVEFEIWDGNPTALSAAFEHTIRPTGGDTEIGDGYPATTKLMDLTYRIETTVDNTPGLDKNFFRGIVDDLRLGIQDVKTIEEGSAAIRRQILAPVESQLRKSNSLAVVFGIVGVLSLFVTLFFQFFS